MGEHVQGGVGGLTGVRSYIRLSLSKLWVFLKRAGRFFWKVSGGCTCGMKPVTFSPVGMGFVELEQTGERCFWCGKRRVRWLVR
jgi:hypothetical protein